MAAKHRSFLTLDRVRLGVTGTLLIVGALVLALNLESVPVLGRGITVHAEFADASGLAVGDSVQISGVPVGEVRAIELAGTEVDVEFDVIGDHPALGDETTATIKVETVLGRRFIELAPRGSGDLDDGALIPLARTTSGYDIARSLQEATGEIAQTDKPNLAATLDQLSALQEELPEDLEATVDGLSRLSNSIASRDAGIRQLLDSAEGVSAILAERNQQVTALFEHGSGLLAALDTRAATIHRILVQAEQVADALTGIAEDNAATLKPTLDQLHALITTLNNNYDNLNSILIGLQRFTTQVGEAVASGPFFGVLLHNIVPANLAGQIPGSPGGTR
ncbi:Mce family protein [Nocardia farcinica]|uniref:MCE family protein n=2 Tax=Nocardia farcinica TaxID=37329 RepID=UPI000A3BE160|nr:MCE family protein [Nocardia farcinica]SUE28856.1 Mce family protein [Nocardia farcinica]